MFNFIYILFVCHHFNSVHRSSKCTSINILNFHQPPKRMVGLALRMTVEELLTLISTRPWISSCTILFYFHNLFIFFNLIIIIKFQRLFWLTQPILHMFVLLNAFSMLIPNINIFENVVTFWICCLLTPAAWQIWSRGIKYFECQWTTTSACRRKGVFWNHTLQECCVTSYSTLSRSIPKQRWVKMLHNILAV